MHNHNNQITATSVQIRVPNLSRKSIRTGWVNTRKSSRCGSDFSSQISVNPFIALQIGGGLLAGAAALAGGYYAYEKHKKGNAQEEVSSLLHFSDIPLTYHRRRTKAPHRDILPLTLSNPPRSPVPAIHLTPGRVGFWQVLPLSASEPTPTTSTRNTRRKRLKK